MAFLSLLRPSDVVVDVGAHRGLFAVAAAKFTRRVVAIEPNPRSIGELRDLARANDLTNLEALEIAIGREEAATRLWLCGTQSNLVAPTKKASESIIVPTRALDDLGIKPDAIKVDVEGYEGHVLEGARRCLETARLIGLEVHPEALQRADADADALLRRIPPTFREVIRYRSAAAQAQPTWPFQVLFQRDDEGDR